MRRKACLIACTLWCCLALAQGNGRAISVEVVRVQKRVLSEVVRCSGTVIPARRVKVFPKVSGVLEKICVDKGQRVKKGDVIAVIEHRLESAREKELEASLKVAEAALKQAEAQLALARVEKERAVKLLEGNGMSKQDYDRVVARYRVAVAGRDLAAARLEMAKRALGRMKIRLDDFTVKAPFGGLVSARFMDAGALCSPSVPLVSLVDDGILKVSCEVPQVDVFKVQPGQDARVLLDGGRSRPGKVSLVVPALDPRTRTAHVEIVLSSLGKREGSVRLLPGMFVKVEIAAVSKVVTAVPAAAVLRTEDGGWYVFAVKDGRAYRREVSTGLRDGDWVEVVGGLEEGALVVVRGYGALKEGAEVVVKGSGAK